MGSHACTQLETVFVIGKLVLKEEDQLVYKNVSLNSKPAKHNVRILFIVSAAMLA